MSTAGSGKRIMEENVQRINKIWFAFTKFVKNQVVTNGRVVDTGLIGLFFNDSQRQTQYMPSPEYLDAGRFKLQKGPRGQADEACEENDQTKQAYDEKYRNKLSVSDRFMLLNRCSIVNVEG